MLCQTGFAFAKHYIVSLLALYFWCLARLCYCTGLLFSMLALRYYCQSFVYLLQAEICSLSNIAVSLLALYFAFNLGVKHLLLI